MARVQAVLGGRVCQRGGVDDLFPGKQLHGEHFRPREVGAPLQHVLHERSDFDEGRGSGVGRLGKSASVRGGRFGRVDRDERGVTSGDIEEQGELVREATAFPCAGPELGPGIFGRGCPEWEDIRWTMFCDNIGEPQLPGRIHI